jgi:hypothetical protein
MVDAAWNSVREGKVGSVRVEAMSVCLVEAAPPVIEFGFATNYLGDNRGNVRASHVSIRRRGRETQPRELTGKGLRIGPRDGKGLSPSVDAESSSSGHSFPCAKQGRPHQSADEAKSLAFLSGLPVDPRSHNVDASLCRGNLSEDEKATVFEEVNQRLVHHIFCSKHPGLLSE